LKNQTRPIRKLSEKCVRTASGGETQVTGAITLPVGWEGETKDLEFLIVPGLTQRYYFGINFGEVAAVETTPDFDLMTGDLDMNNTLKPETAYTPHQLTPEQHSKLQQVIDTYPSCLEKGLGKTNLEQHIIEVTNEDLPIKQRHYPISPAKQKLVYAEQDRMLGLGVIEESNSSWSSPVTLVKKGQKNRLCLDARKVNSRTIKDAYPLPHIEGLLSRLQERYYISAIDLKDAFWQIPLESKSREKTAFTVPGRPIPSLAPPNRCGGSWV